MQNIIIISVLDLHAGNSAACSRMQNLSKSLALAGKTIYLCSTEYLQDFNLKDRKAISNQVYSLGKKSSLRSNNRLISRAEDLYSALVLVLKIERLVKSLEGGAVVYLYPSTKISIEIFSVIYLKAIRKNRLFYEANEVRKFYLYNRVFSDKWLKRAYQKLSYSIQLGKYQLGERLTTYYSGLVVISTNIQKYYSRYNDNTFLLPILSDTSVGQRPQPPSVKYRPDEPFRICFAGSILLKKEGFDLLYEALARIKSRNASFELHLYGPVYDQLGERKLVKEIPAQYGIGESVCYHGTIAQNKILTELQKYDLLILPRPLTPQTHYGFSTKLSEYMVSGVPVLATDVSDNALYIKDGINGYIIAPGNLNEMADKFIEIIRTYPKDADAIVSNAFKTAEMSFDYRNFSDSLAAFFDNPNNRLGELA